MTPVDLTVEQRSALDAVVNKRENVYIGGPAGTGKSTLLSALRAALIGRKVGITATTGCASLLIGGQTLHSFLGLGLADKPAVDIYATNVKRRKVSGLRTLEVLIVDEVSMASAQLIDLVSAYLRLVKKRQDCAFGGVQMVFVGDFAQIQPVKGDYAFESAEWRAAGVRQYLLTRVFRQGDDAAFMDILSRLRYGRRLRADFEKLAACKDTVFPTHIRPTKMYALNRDVNSINESELQALVAAGAESKVFETAYCSRCPEHRAAVRAWADGMDVPASLTLAVGAQVVVTWNVQASDGIVNGTRACVRAFSGSGVVVVLVDGRVVSMLPQRVTSLDEGDAARAGWAVEYLPLKLAFAITHHRSQGMTLDAVEVDLGSSVFGYGQAYTALSRARDLASVRIVDLSPAAFKAAPQVLEFYGVAIKKN